MSVIVTERIGRSRSRRIGSDRNPGDGAADRDMQQAMASQTSRHRAPVSVAAQPLNAILRAWVVAWLVLAGVSGCTPAVEREAALALQDIAAGTGPSILKVQTPAPGRSTIRYQVDGRHYSGDLYLSPQAPLAGLVLVPGVVPDGKDDARLVALANTLARLRFAVLVPDMQGLRRYRVRGSDVGEVADAFRYLLSRPELVPGGRAGIAGFSYGAGPVLLAGLQADIRERVRFILALGGYHDLHSMVRYFTTGYYRSDTADAWAYLAPHPYAAWVFALSNAELLERPADRARLQAYVRALAGPAEDRPAAPPTGLAADAQALVELLLNRDPEQVAGLLAALSPRIRDELQGINPAAHDLTRLGAELILVHGRSDNIIPYTESIALAAAAPPGRTRLFLIDGFAHVDVRPTERDLPQLKRAMVALLTQRASTPD